MGNRRDYLIEALTAVCHKMAQEGWVANHDGNVSLKLDGNLLCTPTAIAKADMVPALILDLDMDGKKLAGVGNPFSEIKLHLAAYRCREDINAVVHAHPPLATAWGLVGGDFDVRLPEAVVSIGDRIPTAPYAMPGAAGNDGIAAAALARCDVFMMAGNGVLAVGRDVNEAFLRIQLLEHLLKIDYYARTMGTPMTLPAQDKQELLNKRAALGLGPKDTTAFQADSASSVGSPLGFTAPSGSAASNDVIKELIAQELKNLLTNK